LFELVSASDLFFLLSADAPFIPVHSVKDGTGTTGFSGAILINVSSIQTLPAEENALVSERFEQSVLI